MYNPYGVPGNQKPQATGYYQQMQQNQQPQQPQQPQQLQQPLSYNQVGGQNTGFSNVQSGMNSYLNPQMSSQQFTGYNPNNSQFNQANIGQTTGNYYGQQNNGLLNVPGIDSSGKPGSSQSPFATSNNFQSPPAQQSQGTGYHNVPFQQPQIQQPQPQQTQQNQQPQQVQQTGMQPQLLAQQRTGPQPQLLQQQQTGFGQSQPLLPQQTGFYMQSSQQQAPLEPLRPTATGFVNSFANNGINNDVNIPARRLSFITANDQAKFEKLFRSRVAKGSNTISGNDCRAILMKSGLQPSQLAKIWALCDSSKAGELLFPEFALAMHLVNDVLQGDSIPYELDTKTKNEVSSFIDAINLSIASQSYTDLSQARTPFDQLVNQGTTGLQAQNTGFMPQTSFGMPLQTQITGRPVNNAQDNFAVPLQSQITGGAVSNAQNNFGVPLQSQITGGAVSNAQNSFGVPLQSQITGGGLPATPNSFGMPLQSQVTGGGLKSQNTGYMPQTSFGLPVQPQVGPQLNQQLTGNRLQSQNTGFMPQTSFLQNQVTGNGMLQQQTTGGFAPSLPNQNTGAFNSFAPQNTVGANIAPNSQTSMNGGIQQPQFTGGPIGTQPSGNTFQQQITGGPLGTLPPLQQQQQQQPVGPSAANLTTQSTGSLIPQQATGPPIGAQQFGGSQNQPYRGFATAVPSQSTGNLSALQSQQTGYLPPSGFNPTMPLTAQKTGFGNNEIYAQSNFGSNFNAESEDSITPEEKSLFYKIFETYDTEKKGLLESTSAVEIFRKSGLNRSDLEHIWNLCDVNNSGSLNKQEFALGMHLVYRRLNGYQLPNRLPLSLIPSSTKIIDNVKNQLKNTRSNEGKQKTAKIDALSYKNNDDEAALPSFRNRRKVFSTANEKPVSSVGASSSTSDANKKKEKLASLRKAIKEKRDRLNAERNREQSTSEQDELRRIETLKAEIRDLPQFSNVENDAVPAELRERFDGIISKLPHLFSQITDADNEITNARIQLFKMKTPSSIVGTGPNGEITEDDRKKAKSKALLKARMDALTGKQVEVADSLDQEERRYNTEISKIRDESTKNQHIIDDIRRSISEISASLKSNLNGGVINGNPADFGTWEFGVGLEPDVRRFINALNSAKLSTARPNNASSAVKPQQNAGNVSQPQSSSYNSREPVENVGPGSYSSDQTGSNSQKAKPAEEDEDEEERHLRDQLEKLKLKKKADKERRLAELRRQIEEAENDSEDEQEINQNAGTKAPLSSSVQGSTPSLDRNSQPNAQSTSTPAVVANSVPPVTSTPTGGRNPFFRQEISSTSSFDAKAAENQRRLQRGLGEDDESDGWSDDEPQQKPVSSPTADEADAKKAAQVNTPVAPPASLQPSVTSSSQAPAVPLAPPLPAVSQTVPPAVESSEPVPVAPPLPQVTGSNTAPPVPTAPPLPQVTGSNIAPPVPTAPPLPQVGSGSVFSMPPPPSLPGAKVQALTPAQTPQLAETQNDSDDVLSIPDSVASEEDVNESAPTGIPPPPPLP